MYLVKEKIKILVVEPNKKAYEKIINNTISEIYGLVYYPYREIEIFQNVYLIYSKEATQNKDNTFKLNRKINNIEIYGTFVIVGKKGNEFISLTDKQIQVIQDKFLD